MVLEEDEGGGGLVYHLTSPFLPSSIPLLILALFSMLVLVLVLLLVYALVLILDDIPPRDTTRAVDAFLVHRFLLDSVPHILSCHKTSDGQCHVRHADDKGDHLLVDDD